MKRSVLYILLLVILSCQEENQPPTCIITSPSNNSHFDKGDSIFVSVDAVDPDGQISAVKIYLDDEGITSIESLPYEYWLHTRNIASGNYTLEVSARDDQDLIAFDEVNITINPLVVFPNVATTSILNITETSAQSGGNISDNGASISARGVCWSTSENPTIADNKTSDGTGTGSYTSNLTGLECATNYYVRAYATNEVGTSYGDQLVFTTGNCPDYLPIVTNSEISDITENSAQCIGTITDDGGSDIIARGVCWSTSENPTIEDSLTSDGPGTGFFISNLTGLTCATAYYARAYATNEFGTTYGVQRFFTTGICSVQLPTVTTAFVSNITESAAIAGGNISDEGGASVTSRGVCWSTSQGPTISDSYTTVGMGTGSFESNLTGLTKSTIYYVRAYATSSAGTSYGDEVNFRTFEGTTVTDYDGNTYWTVTIGEQLWMAENLKVTHYSDGSSIPLVEGTVLWDAMIDIDKAYCWSDDNIVNRDIYGGLYTWAAAMNGTASSDTNPSGVQGICPDGWHLPSDSEWMQLEMYLGMSEMSADSIWWRGADEGGKLKETGTEHWSDPNRGATNETGFTARSNNPRASSGDFEGGGSRAYFWTATAAETDEWQAWDRGLGSGNLRVSRKDKSMSAGYAVRCVQD